MTEKIHLMDKRDTQEINNHAAVLGINIKYSDEVERFTNLKEHIYTYSPPEPPNVAELLFITDPADWDNTIRDWAATSSIPQARPLRDRMEEIVIPALTKAIRDDAASIIKQAAPAATKAATVVNNAVNAGIMSLTDYEGPAHRGTTQHLVDAKDAIRKLDAYARLVAYVSRYENGARQAYLTAAVIAPPANLEPLPVEFGYANKRAITATPEAHASWRANLHLNRAYTMDSTFETAIGQYAGFTLDPAKTLTEVHDRANQIMRSLNENLIDARG